MVQGAGVDKEEIVRTGINRISLFTGLKQMQYIFSLSEMGIWNVTTNSEFHKYFFSYICIK